MKPPALAVSRAIVASKPDGEIRMFGKRYVWRCFELIDTDAPIALKRRINCE